MNWGGPGKWDDGTNADPPLRGIMEFAPEPPAGASLALAGLALLGRWRSQTRARSSA